MLRLFIVIGRCFDYLWMLKSVKFCVISYMVSGG